MTDSEKDKRRAQKCLDCGACNFIRRKQWRVLTLMLRIENKICPYARAYERVYGRKAHERIPEA